MRIIDIAVASGYAAVCLSLIVLMNPVAPRESAVGASAESKLDSAISGYLGHVGLPFLTTSPEAGICATAAEEGNATLVFDVLLNGEGCASLAPPTSPLASSSLTIDLPGRTVVIEAWLVRR